MATDLRFFHTTCHTTDERGSYLLRMSGEGTTHTYTESEIRKVLEQFPHLAEWGFEVGNSALEWTITPRCGGGDLFSPPDSYADADFSGPIPQVIKYAPVGHIRWVRYSPVQWMLREDDETIAIIEEGVIRVVVRDRYGIDDWKTRKRDLKIAKIMDGEPTRHDDWDHYPVGDFEELLAWMLVSYDGEIDEGPFRVHVGPDHECITYHP